MPRSLTKTPSRNSGLASEFYLAHVLYRLGYLGIVTYGNAKALDIVAVNPADNRTATIEVRSTKYKTNLPLRLRNGAPPGNHFFVLVAYEDWKDLETVPRIWVIPARSIPALLKPWSANAKPEATCIQYRDLMNPKIGAMYRDAWNLLFPGRRRRP